MTLPAKTDFLNVGFTERQADALVDLIRRQRRARFLYPELLRYAVYCSLLVVFLFSLHSCYRSTESTGRCRRTKPSSATNAAPRPRASAPSTGASPASKPNSWCATRPGHEDLPPYTCTHSRISAGASSQYRETSLASPETGPSSMKPTIVEHSAVEHAPFSTVVYERSLPDRHETGPDGQPRLLPRETFHHVYLQDTATGQRAQLGIAATAAIAKRIAAEIRHGRLPAVLLSHGDLRYAAWLDSIFPAPEAALPEASGSPLAPIVYEWSPAGPVRDRR